MDEILKKWEMGVGSGAVFLIMDESCPLPPLNPGLMIPDFIMEYRSNSNIVFIHFGNPGNGFQSILSGGKDESAIGWGNR